MQSDTALQLLDQYALTAVENAYYHYYHPPPRGKGTGKGSGSSRSRSRSRKGSKRKKAHSTTTGADVSSSSSSSDSLFVREYIARQVIIHILRSVRATLERLHAFKTPLHLFHSTSSTKKRSDNDNNYYNRPIHETGNGMSSSSSIERTADTEDTENLTSRELLTTVVSRLERLEKCNTRRKTHHQVGRGEHEHGSHSQLYLEEYERLPNLLKVWCETLLQELLLQVLKTIENRIPDIFKTSSGSSQGTEGNTNESNERRQFRAMLKVIIFDCQHQIVKDRNRLAQQISQYSKFRSKVLVRLVRYMAEDLLSQETDSFEGNPEIAPFTDTDASRHLVYASDETVTSPMKTVSADWQTTHETELSTPEVEPNHCQHRNNSRAFPDEELRGDWGGPHAFNLFKQCDAFESEVAPERLTRKINSSFYSPLLMAPTNPTGRRDPSLTVQSTMSINISTEVKTLTATSCAIEESIAASILPSCSAERATVTQEIREQDNELRTSKKCLRMSTEIQNSLRRKLLLARAFYSLRLNCRSVDRALPVLTTCSKSMSEEIAASSAQSYSKLEQARALVCRYSERYHRLRSSVLRKRCFSSWKQSLQPKIPELTLSSPLSGAIEAQAKPTAEVINADLRSNVRRSISGVREVTQETKTSIETLTFQFTGALQQTLYQCLEPLLRNYASCIRTVAELRRKLEAMRFQMHCSIKWNSVRAWRRRKSYQLSLQRLRRKLFQLKHKTVKSERQKSAKRALALLLPVFKNMYSENQRLHSQLRQVLEAQAKFGVIIPQMKAFRDEQHSTCTVIVHKLCTLMKQLEHLTLCKDKLQTYIPQLLKRQVSKRCLQTTQQKIRNLAITANSLKEPLINCTERAWTDTQQLNSKITALEMFLPSSTKECHSHSLPDSSPHDEVSAVPDITEIRRRATLARRNVNGLRELCDDLRMHWIRETENAVESIKRYNLLVSRTTKSSPLYVHSGLNEVAVNTKANMFTREQAMKMKAEARHLSSIHRQLANTAFQYFEETVLDIDQVKSRLNAAQSVYSGKAICSWDLQKTGSLNELGLPPANGTAGLISSQVSGVRKRLNTLSSDFEALTSSLKAEWKQESSTLELMQDRVMQAVKLHSSMLQDTKSRLYRAQEEKSSVRSDYENLENMFVQVARCIAKLSTSVRNGANNLFDSMSFFEQAVANRLATQEGQLKCLEAHREKLNRSCRINKLSLGDDRAAIKAVERIFGERVSMIKEDARAALSESNSNFEQKRRVQAHEMQKEFERRLRDKEAQCKREVLAYQRESIESFRKYKQRVTKLAENRFQMLFEDMRSQSLQRPHREMGSIYDVELQQLLLSELDQLLQIVDNSQPSDADTLRRLEYQLSQNNLTVNIVHATERPPGHTRHALSQIGNLLNGRSLTYQPFDLEETEKTRPYSTSTVETRELEDLSEGDIEEAVNMIGELYTRVDNSDENRGVSKDENDDELNQSQLSSEDDNSLVATPKPKSGQQKNANVGDSLTKHPNWVMKTPYNGPVSKDGPDDYSHKPQHEKDIRKRILQLQQIVLQNVTEETKKDKSQDLNETPYRSHIPSRFTPRNASKNGASWLETTGYSKDPLTPTTWEESLRSPPPTFAPDISTKASRQSSQLDSGDHGVSRSVESFYTI